MIERDYSSSALSSIKRAKSVAYKENHSTYGVCHLITALINEPTGLEEVISGMGKDVNYILEWFEVMQEMYKSTPFNGKEDVHPDDEVVKVFEESERSKIKLGTDNIDALCVFSAVIRDGVVYSSQQIETLGITEQDILKHYNANQPVFLESDFKGDVSTISSYLDNLQTDEVIQKGKLILGREKEVRLTLENFERSESKGIILVGDSGIGKTATINYFVRELSYSTDEYLKSHLVFKLNVPRLLASASSENEANKKVSEVFSKLESINVPSILVIDDLHVLLENATGKANAIVNILNAQLSEGKINMIFTINADSYRKSLEKHPINSKLEILKLEELGEVEMLKCLHKHKKRLEEHFSIKISDKAIEETIHLSKRYFKEKKLPYGAIDLIDKTVAAVKMSNATVTEEVDKIEKDFKEVKDSEKFDFSDLQLALNTIYRKVSVIQTSRVNKSFQLLPDNQNLDEEVAKIDDFLSALKELANDSIDTVSEMDIEAVVSEITGIPLGKIQTEEKERLLNIDKKLKERVKGQSSAIQTLSDAIIESRSGLSNPKQPIGSFFFLGPTGTGKTELTKSLAELLFDDENAMIRFDMSEFKEEHSAALLYGAPPGYVGYEEGGMLVTKIRQRPYSVVLFDEIEKAHSSVYDVFLQLMDEGIVHDKLGREGDFSNAIVIFTSNIGSQWIAEQITEGKTPTSNELIEVMAQYFRPEFLGRLTEVVPFAPINQKVAQDILVLHFNKLKKQLEQQKQIELNISEDALMFLSKKGFSQKYGARPIAGVVRTYVKKVMSKMIVSEQVKKGDRVLLDYKNENLVWELL